MTIDVFWQQIAEAINGECDECPVYQYAVKTNTERMCDKVGDCAEGLMVLHKKLQEEELKMIKREESKRKKSVYRFWVCKHGNQKLNEFIPVTAPFYTLNEANEWMIKHSSGTDEILYAIRADKDMWMMKILSDWSVRKMSKGKLIVEIEKADGEIRTANFKIKDMTIEELSHVVGAIMNAEISKNAKDEEEKVIWKAHAIHDICLQIGFKSTAARLEEVFNKLEREE